MAIPTLHDARLRLAENGPPREREPGDFARVSLPHADGDILRDLLVAERSRVVVEVGLAYGSSALAIAEALAAQEAAPSMHVIIDAHQDQFEDAGLETLTDAGLAGRFTLVRDRSQLVLPRLVSEDFVADAAFVDGGHRFHHVFVDLCFLRDIVRPGGLVVLDDVQWPSVATAVRYFEVNTGWQPLPIDALTRLRAYRLPDPPREPAFEDFRAFGLE